MKSRKNTAAPGSHGDISAGMQQVAAPLGHGETKELPLAHTTPLKPADPYLTNPFLAGLVPGGKLWPGQEAFLTPPDAGVTLDYRVFQGGIACGKTFAAVVLGIALCRETPGIRGLVTSKTYSKLRDGVIEDYLHHFRSLGWVPGEDYVYKKGERRIIFPKWVNALGEPSQILFRGLPRVEFIPALALGWVHIEELAAFPMPVFNALHHFLRQPGVNCHRLFATTRPEDLQAKPKHPNNVDTTGWIECQFDVENTRLIESGKVKPLSEPLYKHHSSKRIIASTLENEALSQTFVAKMLQMYYPQTSTDYLVVNPLFVNVLGENRYPHEALAARDRFYEG